MTGEGPTSFRPPQSPPGDAAAAEASQVAAPPSPAVQRANRLSAANMLRSLLPLVLICLALVGWAALRQTPADPVQEIDPSSTVALAAARAGYPVLAPSGLPEDYRPTSARTDAGNAGEGDPVTLEVGYLTPSEEFAGFVISDDPRSAPVASVLDGAVDRGTVTLGGEEWARSTTTRNETALSRTVGEVTVLVTGSASDAELEAVAEAVRPYSG